jgi:pimeloyl-ACP methyl ester carboxylesterase
VLHASGERPYDALARWSAEATRQGYILAAPSWGGEGGYLYSAEEHIAVTELVKDLRRRYAVDSDRVFLAGFSEGATMAYDVALSHPDLFAGVVPVNGRPKPASLTWYMRNAQYLPFYIVCGEVAGGAYGSVNWVNDRREAFVHQRTTLVNRYPFENWMSRGYPSLMTIYKGRPTEFYMCEVPNIFDWMNRKRRAAGFPELGRNPNQGSASEEFQSMRQEDNHFYWLSIEQIHEKYVNENVGTRTGSPAALQAHVRDNNRIYIHSRGIKTLRAWFGRIWDPQAGWKPMIDFSKPVTITVNGRPAGKSRVVQPSLQTMLDDLYERGDRQRMFLAYVDLNNLQ